MLFPEIDAVLINHDHHDRLDSDTIKKIRAKSKGHVGFFCGLDVKTCLLGLGVGLKPKEALELISGMENNYRWKVLAASILCACLRNIAVEELGGTSK